MKSLHCWILMTLMAVSVAACRPASRTKNTDASFHKMLLGSWLLAKTIFNGKEIPIDNAEPATLTVTKTTLSFQGSTGQETSKYIIDGSKLIDPDKPTNKNDIMTIKSLTKKTLHLQLAGKNETNTIEMVFNRQ